VKPASSGDTQTLRPPSAEARAHDATADALLFATVPAVDGGPAAALAVDGTTLIARLRDQLRSLGVRRSFVVTRPQWAGAVAEALGDDAVVLPSDDVSADVRHAADVARAGSGPLVLANAHVVTHREALAGLLVDPRISSGVLTTAFSLVADRSLPVRSARKRVVSAASPYHRVTRRSGYFLGVMKLEPEDRARLDATALRVADLAAEPRPAGWDDELRRKEREWRVELWRRSLAGETGVAPPPAEAPPPDQIPLQPADEEAIAIRRRATAEDALSLVLVGLVRTEVELAPGELRRFFFAAPVSAAEAEQAAEELDRIDGDRVLLDAAVKSTDGFFTTFFVSPYSKYIARFAARRGLTPNQVTAVSFALGVAAAAAFAVGDRTSLILGAILLQVSFTVDCVDGQLARYTRTFSKLGAWLDSVFDRGKEYLVYGGLAYGAARGFGDDVWALAAAALTLQTVRHMSDFAYVAAQRRVVAATPRMPLETPLDVEGELPAKVPPSQRPQPPLRRRIFRALVFALRKSRVGVWGNRIIRMPIGERFALISVTAAVASPRTTFVALLIWGAVGAAYAFSVRTLISFEVPKRIAQAVSR
jgi:phosphatidylglycerophosphate synthase